MAACLAAGAHEGLISVLGRIRGHPDEGADADGRAGGFQGGIVMQLVPLHYQVLGLPPSMESCTRDCYAEDASLSLESCLAILSGIADAASHLHDRGIAHGDLYGHNILWSSDYGGHALLGDFGAATIYGKTMDSYDIEKLEVLAFAHLVDDLLGLVRRHDTDDDMKIGEVVTQLRDMQTRCSVEQVRQRPTFDELTRQLQKMMGWRTMMRLPN
jgi:serine/threonine protein kinase